MKRLIRQMEWWWILGGGLLMLGGAAAVWAGNVSDSINDAGGNVGIGTTTANVVGSIPVAGTNLRVLAPSNPDLLTWVP